MTEEAFAKGIGFMVTCVGAFMAMGSSFLADIGSEPYPGDKESWDRKTEDEKAHREKARSAKLWARRLYFWGCPLTIVGALISWLAG